MVSSAYKWLKFPLVLAILSIFTGFSTKPAPGKGFHPIYVSVVEMEYNASEKTVEISCKVFSEDFETAIGKATGVPADVHHPKDKALLEKQMADYVRKHLQVKLDGKTGGMEWVGFENESQFTFTYFQVNNVNAAPKKIDVLVNIFHELYQDQINIVHVTVSGNRKSTKLNYPETGVKLEF